MSAVEIDQFLVDLCLLSRIHVHERLRDFALNCSDGMTNAASSVTLQIVGAMGAVARFNRFMTAGGSACGDRSARPRSILEFDEDTQSWITARVQDFHS